MRSGGSARWREGGACEVEEELGPVHLSIGNERISAGGCGWLVSFFLIKSKICEALDFSSIDSVGLVWLGSSIRL